MLNTQIAQEKSNPNHNVNALKYSYSYNKILQKLSTTHILKYILKKGNDTILRVYINFDVIQISLDIIERTFLCKKLRKAFSTLERKEKRTELGDYEQHTLTALTVFLKKKIWQNVNV